MSVAPSTSAVRTFGTNVVGGAVSCIAQVQPSLNTAILFTSATKHLSALVNAGAGAVIIRNQEALAQNPFAQGAAIAGKTMSENPAVPMTQLLNSNPQTWTEPAAEQAVARLVTPYAQLAQGAALRMISLLSTTKGSLLFANGLLDKAKLYGVDTPPRVQSAANIAFQTVFCGGMLLNAWREVQNAPTYYELAKGLTKIAILGQMAYKAYTNSELNAPMKTKFENALKAIRNPIICMYPKAAVASAVFALASGGVAGGLAGMLPQAKPAAAAQ